MAQARPVLPTGEVPPVSPEVSNGNTVKILREWRDMAKKMAEERIANPRAPAIKRSPREKYIWYLEQIAATYGGDLMLMAAEIAELQDETWADRLIAARKAIQQGVPYEQSGFPTPIMSPPFVDEWAIGLPLLFRMRQREFIRLHKQYGPEAG